MPKCCCYVNKQMFLLNVYEQKWIRNQLGFKIKEKYVSNDIVDFSFEHFSSKNEFVE